MDRNIKDDNQQKIDYYKEGVQTSLPINEEPTETQQETDKPVTCLGMTFANDTERRAYFREELRKKLPELKKIEGFPIGEDEDIINLSDPPYYTACPNPWLNDFVNEWEKGKIQLEKEGKRQKNFDVNEPYASDVSEGKNNPIYNAHSYHTKVPHPAIMRYLLHYTQPGDIVFDGFAGTGMVGVAASRCATEQVKDAPLKMMGGRRCICSDLSPYASFISYIYNSGTEPSWYIKEANNIIDEIEKEYGWMYKTKHTDGKVGTINFVVWSDVFLCPSCGKEIVYYSEGVDDEKKEIREVFPCPHCGSTLKKTDLERYKVSIFDNLLNQTVFQTKNVPVLIRYTTNDGKRHEKKPDAYDYEVLNRIDSLELPYWVPTEKMMDKDGKWGEQWRTFHEGMNNVHHYFTKRNLFIAAAIYNKTNGKGVLNSMMTSYLTNVGSKFARYKMGKSGNANMPGTLYVASATAEQNLFLGYRGKIKDLAKVFSSEYRQVIGVNSASNIPLSANTVDYIFTDPPFGDNIMYSELNFIQECWLKVRTCNDDEAIVSKYYSKGIPEYQDIMYRCFLEYYRILKPGHWITIEFSNTRASVWNAIQQALQKSGFIIANSSSIDKKQGSYNAVTSTTAVKQDLVITCYKPSENTTKAFTSSGNTDKNVWDFVDEYLHHLPVHIERNDSTTVVVERSPKILYDRLISYYVQHGYSVPMDAADFQAGLRERYLERDGMFFTAEQASEYESKKKSLPGGVISMGIMINSEADGIQWLRNELSVAPKTRQDLYTGWMQARGVVRKGDRLPELDDILEENFIKEPDGKWRVPDANDEKDLEILRTKALLKEFNLCVEQASKPKSKIKEVRVEALRAGFKQCYIDKDFKTIVMVGDKIPENLLTEDEVLLQYYDIASSRV